MSLSGLYFVTQDLGSYFVDHSSGLPLAGGQIFFYRDIARTQLKPIFTLSGSPPYSPSSYVTLPNPLTLSQVGTIADSSNDDVPIYYYPWVTNLEGKLELDLYYVVITDSAGTIQFTREAWPNVTIGEGPGPGPDPAITIENFITNQISNPQFTNILINEAITTTYSVSGDTLKVFEFAPDWFFQISGTGNVIVQIIPVTGLANVPTSPPYLLEITVSAGVTDCRLTQRFYDNSGLWTSTSADDLVFLYGSFVAQNMAGGTAGIEMFYLESTPGYIPVLIVPGNFSSPYVVVSGSTLAAIPQSTNPGSRENAYVDIYLSFGAATHVQVSSIQLIPLGEAPENFILPDFDSSNRNESYQGDYYIPRAAAKQIDSYLTGWDFCLNPFQFGTSGTITTTPTYICDQTIAACGTTGNVNWGQNNSRGIGFTPAGANDAFYIQQYLSGPQVFDMVSKSMSVNVAAYTDSNVTNVRVYLFTSTGGGIPTLPTGLGNIASDGTFTLTAGGWSAVDRSGLTTAQGQVITGFNNMTPQNDNGFSGWNMGLNDLVNFAIVITFQYTQTNIPIFVNSVSMVPGDLPCRPGVKTFDDTLQECQYYYEKSYNLNVTPGTNTPTGSKSVVQGNELNTGAWRHLIYLDYYHVKRIAVTPIFYAINGVINEVLFTYFDANTGARTDQNLNISGWVSQESSPRNYYLFPSDIGLIGPVNILTSMASFQFVADARLAVV